MKFFLVKINLNSSQATIMDQLKSIGAEVIQMSDGLCVKSTKGLGEISSLLPGDCQLSEISMDEVARAENAPPDLKAFLGI